MMINSTTRRRSSARFEDDNKTSITQPRGVCTFNWFLYPPRSVSYASPHDHTPHNPYAPSAPNTTQSNHYPRRQTHTSNEPCFITPDQHAYHRPPPVSGYNPFNIRPGPGFISLRLVPPTRRIQGITPHPRLPAAQSSSCTPFIPATPNAFTEHGCA
jgi:hypothetical protein